MKNLDLVLENVCIRHINKNSRLSEAADKAIRENTINLLFEAFNSTMVVTESAEDKKSLLSYLSDAWNVILKFFNTIINKIKNVFSDNLNVAKSDLDYINKNKSAMSEGIKSMSEDELTIRCINPNKTKLILLDDNTVIKDILKRVGDVDELKKFTDEIITGSWSEMTGISKMEGDISKYKELFINKCYNSVVVNSNAIPVFAEVAVSMIADAINGLNSLNKSLSSATFNNIKSYLNDDNIKKQEIDLILNEHKRILQEYIKCYNTIMDYTIKSKNNIMIVVRLAVKKSAKKSK